MTRGPPRVRVIAPKDALDMSRSGLRNAGVFETLYASARNSSDVRSLNCVRFETLTSTRR